MLKKHMAIWYTPRVSRTKSDKSLAAPCGRPRPLLRSGVENDDASAHPFDQDIVTQRHSPEDKQHEETNRFCSLLMAAIDKVNRIFTPTQVSAG